VRPAETNAIPNLDQARASAARTDFLEHTREMAIANRALPGYQPRTIPWVGARHDTWQSAEVAGGKLTASYDPPPGLDPTLANGDGTVARVSAVPQDMENSNMARFVIERHGWLTNNEMTLGPLLETLTDLAAAGSGGLFGKPQAIHPAINLRLEPLHALGEPVRVGLKLADAGPEAQGLTVRAEPVGRAGPAVTRPAQVSLDQPAEVVLEGLPAGMYQLTVEAQVGGAQAPAAVHGVFEVADPAAVQ